MQLLVSRKTTSVVVDGFDNFMTVVKLLDLCSHEHFGVNGILYHIQLTNAGCLPHRA